ERHERLVHLGVIPPDALMAPPDQRLGEMRNDYGIPDWENVDQSMEAHLMEIYAAIVDRMDQGIGRVLAALRESGIEDNTLVLFFSDNGGCAGLPVAENMGPYYSYNAKAIPGSKESYLMCGPGWAMVQSAPFRRYKGWTYEGGIASPLIARWPGQIAPNTWTKVFGHVVDLMPTLQEIAGARHPRARQGEPTPPLEGTSLLPVLLGEDADPGREQ